MFWSKNVVKSIFGRVTVEVIVVEADDEFTASQLIVMEFKRRGYHRGLVYSIYNVKEPPMGGFDTEAEAIETAEREMGQSKQKQPVLAS